MPRTMTKVIPPLLLAISLLASSPVFAQGLSPQCHPPVAVDDAYELRENASLDVPAPGVLENDSDPYQLPLSAAVVLLPEHGSLVFNADGSFTYTPQAGYFGQDQFTYMAKNQYYESHGYYDEAVVTLTITPLPRLYLPILQR